RPDRLVHWRGRRRPPGAAAALRGTGCSLRLRAAAAQRPDEDRALLADLRSFSAVGGDLRPRRVRGGGDVDPSAGTATEHALSKFTPDAKARSGTALCLSGGGYRAALFHLGALRRLNELGLLSKVTTICSVSGGSILAAHLAQRLRPWPKEGEVIGDWDERVAGPFRAFTTKNIRTGPILERLEPWYWPSTSTAVEALAKIYERDLTTLRLAELPEHPRFILCATDMAYGVNWVFERTRAGDY